MTRPTQADIDAMRQIIFAEHKLIAGSMMCREGGHCAVGALLAAVGATDNQLLTTADASDIDEPLGMQLFNRFHVDWKDMDTLLAANDLVRNTEVREDGTIVVTPENVKQRQGSIERAFKEMLERRSDRPTWRVYGDDDGDDEPYGY